MFCSLLLYALLAERARLAVDPHVISCVASMGDDRWLVREDAQVELFMMARQHPANTAAAIIATGSENLDVERHLRIARVLSECSAGTYETFYKFMYQLDERSRADDEDDEHG